MGELTPEAKKELAEAIAIVREDRFEKAWRAKFAEKDESKPDPEGDPTKNDPAPPPPKDDPTPPPEPRKSGYWGEIFE